MDRFWSMRIAPTWAARVSLQLWRPVIRRADGRDHQTGVALAFAISESVVHHTRRIPVGIAPGRSSLLPARRPASNV